MGEWVEGGGARKETKLRRQSWPKVIGAALRRGGQRQQRQKRMKRCAWKHPQEEGRVGDVIKGL